MSVRKMENHCHKLNSLARVLVGLFLAIFGFCCEASADIDLQKISNLSRTLQFEKIVDEYEDYPWANLNDPGILMQYCYALVETGRDLPDSLKEPKVPQHISNFSKGYYILLKGDYVQALDIFVDLTTKSRGLIWGYIGLLEFDIWTENVANMTEPLTRLKELSEHDLQNISWVVPYYSSYYNFNIGNFDKTKAILVEKKSQLDSDFYDELYVNLLIDSEDDLEEAERYVQKAIKEKGPTPNLITLKAQLMGFRSGPEQQIAYLAKQVDEFPNMWAIKRFYAYTLIDTGEVAKGINILRNLAEQRPFDVMVQLNLAETLLLYQNGRGLKDIFVAINYPFQLPYFNVIMARIFHIQGKDKQAEEHLGIAKSIFPNSKDVLWFSFDKAMDNHAYDSAISAMTEYLDAYPYDIDGMFALLEAYHRNSQHGLVLKIAKKIQKSKRFVKQEILNKIQVYVREAKECDVGQKNRDRFIYCSPSTAAKPPGTRPVRPVPERPPRPRPSTTSPASV